MLDFSQSFGSINRKIWIPRSIDSEIPGYLGKEYRINWKIEEQIFQKINWRQISTNIMSKLLVGIADNIDVRQRRWLEMEDKYKELSILLKEEIQNQNKKFVDMEQNQDEKTHD